MASLSLALSDTKSDYFDTEETTSTPDNNTQKLRVVNEAACIIIYCTKKSADSLRVIQACAPTYMIIDDYLRSIDPLLLKDATKISYQRTTVG